MSRTTVSSVARACAGFSFLLAAAPLGAQIYDVLTVGVTSLQDQAFGFATAIAGDVDGDGRDDLLVGDPGAGFYASGNAGKIVVLSGATGAEIWRHDGTPGSELGYSVARIGDLDGDGVPDYAAGAPGTAPGGRSLVYSGASGAVLFTVDGQANYACSLGTCGTQSDRLGEAVAGPGDIDGDGVPDLVTGSPNARSCNNSCRPGMVGAYSGATGLLLGTRVGTHEAAGYGKRLAPAGDVNGDGLPDVLVGEPNGPYSPFTGSNPGFAHVLSGGSLTIVLSLTGPSSGSGFGSSLASLGDANGDGRSELAIGAPRVNAGGVSQAGAVTIHDGATGIAVLTFAGPGVSALFGDHLSPAGDVDGDGFNEIAVAASGVGGVRLIAPATGSILQTWTTPVSSLAGPANFDGDAVPDLVVGSGGLSGSGFLAPGSVSALSAGTGTPLYSVNGSKDPFGSWVTDAVPIGDFDGDGAPDLAWIAFNARLGIVSGQTGSSLAVVNLGSPVAGYINGFRLAAVGDVNSDQVPDIVVTYPFSPSTALEARAVLVPGATLQVVYTIAHPSCQLQIPPVAVIGDQDADGAADFVMTSPCAPPGPAGAAYVHSGRTGALVRTITGIASGPSNNLALASAGDQNGDGFEDVLVGAPFAPTNMLGAPGEISVLSGSNGALIQRITGPGPLPQFGGAVSSMPDLDGDGARELVAGSGGAAQVRSGATGAVLHSIPEFSLGSGFGAAVAGLGDCDGDGSPDFAVGAPQEQSPGHKGTVRLFSGATGAALALGVGEALLSWFGDHLVSAGDFNRDGLADLVVLAPYAAATPRVRVVSWAGVPDGSTAFGSGCPDPAGRVPGIGAYGGLPDVTNGNPAFGLVVSNLAQAAAPTVIFGLSTSSWNGYGLPLDLGPLGLPGCTLATALDVLLQAGANSAQPAAAFLPLGVPVAPGAAGSTITIQAYVPTTPSASFPGVLSRAVTLVAR